MWFERGVFAVLVVCLVAASAAVGDEAVQGGEADLQWRFLFGESMHPAYLEARGVEVAARRRAVLLDPGDSDDQCYADAPPRVNAQGRPEREAWRMAMSGGLPFVEPGFATLQVVLAEEEPAAAGPFTEESKGGAVHGVAVLLSRSASALLDRTDGMTVFSRGSQRADVQLRLYAADVQAGEGALLDAYVHYTPASPQAVPSRRHLQALLDAADAAALEEQYLSRSLLTLAYYTPPQLVLDRRHDLLRAPRDMPKVALAELQAHGRAADEPFVSVMGFVVATRPIFASWAGKDVTAALMRYYDGEALGSAWRDEGLPPFPDLMRLSPRRQEYLHHHLDSLMSMAGASVVGVLEEFWDDQEDAIYYDLEELDYIHNLQA